MRSVGADLADANGISGGSVFVLSGADMAAYSLALAGAISWGLYNNLSRRQPPLQPALEHRTAHFAGADEQQRTVERKCHGKVLRES